jgi:hypothetical protein
MVPAFSPGIISGVTRPAPPSFLLLSSVQFPILKLKKRFFSAVFSSWRPCVFASLRDSFLAGSISDDARQTVPQI